MSLLGGTPGPETRENFERMSLRSPPLNPSLDGRSQSINLSYEGSPRWNLGSGTSTPIFSAKQLLSRNSTETPTENQMVLLGRVDEVVANREMTPRSSELFGCQVLLECLQETLTTNTANADHPSDLEMRSLQEARRALQFAFYALSQDGRGRSHTFRAIDRPMP